MGQGPRDKKSERDPLVGVVLELEEGTSLGELLILLLLGPTPSLSLYRDPEPTCGNGECLVVLSVEVLEGRSTPSIGVATGRGIRDEMDPSRSHLGPGGPFFDEPCSVCQEEFKSKVLRALRKPKVLRALRRWVDQTQTSFGAGTIH